MPATEAAIADPEIHVTLNGKPFTLVFTLGSLNRLDKIVREKHDKKSILQGINWRELSTEDMTAVLWASMRRHHPDVTLEQLEDMVDAAGLVQLGEGVMRAGLEIVALVTQLIESSLPVIDKLAGAEATTALKKSLIAMATPPQSPGSTSSQPE